MPAQEFMPIVLIFLYIIITIAIVFGIVFTVKYVKNRKSSKEGLANKVDKSDEQNKNDS